MHSGRRGTARRCPRCRRTWKTCSWWRPAAAPTNGRVRHELATDVGDRGQGAAPAPPRPHEPRHDHRDTAAATGAVRLRDQHRRTRHRGRHRRPGEYIRFARAGHGHARHRGGGAGGERRHDGRPVAQVLVDGSDTAVQAAAAQLARVPVDSAAPDMRAPLRSTPPSGAISVVGFYNPERRSAVSIVPGLIGVILTMTMVLFTGIAIVRERERGNMELLIATPLTSTELMIGKVLPYIAIGLVQVSVILAVGLWLFQVPVRGGLLDVFVVAGLLIVANLALGLMISTRARSQFQAMQMTLFVFLPSILLSGFMFPFAGMPKVAQWLAEVLPLTHFVRLIRGVMLRGAGLREMWPEALALSIFIVLMMAAAILRFRKRLD